MQSNHIEVQGKNIHFLSDGKGPVILLFHASPMSSSTLIPLIKLLSNDFTVLAIDTPGYGQSEKPNTQPTQINFYSNLISSLLEKLALQKVAIYGTATGAQIAIRFGIDHPEKTAQLFLDNVAHFDDDERKEIVDAYFPDFKPQKDGSHLSAIWENVVQLFNYFPWCFQEEKYKLSNPAPPLDVLKMIFIEYLKAGPEYDWAYRLAFEHEKLQNMLQLKIPTHIFRWESSIIKPYSDRLFDEPLPKNISSEIIAKTAPRYDSMAQTIINSYQDGSLSWDKSQTRESLENPFNSSTPNIAADFPSIDKDGKQLLTAWNMLDQLHFTSNVVDKNNIFLKWISKNK